MPCPNRLSVMSTGFVPGGGQEPAAARRLDACARDPRAARVSSDDEDGGRKGRFDRDALSIHIMYEHLRSTVNEEFGRQTAGRQRHAWCACDTSGAETARMFTGRFIFWGLHAKLRRAGALHVHGRHGHWRCCRGMGVGRWAGACPSLGGTVQGNPERKYKDSDLTYKMPEHGTNIGRRTPARKDRPRR